MKSAGTALAQLIDYLKEGVFPTWSPEGRKIAFAPLRLGHYEINSMTADGKDQIRLT